MSTQVKCPNCGHAITLSPQDYDSVVMQVRNQAFESEVQARVKELKSQMDAAKNAEIMSARLSVERESSDKINALTQEIFDLKSERSTLKSQLLLTEKDSALKIQKALAEQQVESDAKIRDLEYQVGYYKDLKSRMSTKAVGESLEQYCQDQFNAIRMTAFPRAYFEKDNDARSGSKGDFIYREMVDGVELLSIMFEMKNEMDATATKHKNQDFFKELDRDRNEKGCEYAVLVSLLESESELYNAGIVDVSYQYPKMYVIRPQLFIPMITLLRNAAMNAFEDRRELHRMQSMNLGLVEFENSLLDFKANISKNYDLASRKFDSAISEIDKAIANLEKVKKDLQSSSNNLRYLNDKTAGLTLKKLTRNNSEMRDMFENAGVHV